MEDLGLVGEREHLHRTRAEGVAQVAETAGSMSPSARRTAPVRWNVGSEISSAFATSGIVVPCANV
jgi:hypothetical protein